MDKRSVAQHKVHAYEQAFKSMVEWVEGTAAATGNKFSELQVWDDHGHVVVEGTYFGPETEVHNAFAEGETTTIASDEPFYVTVEMFGELVDKVAAA